MHDLWLNCGWLGGLLHLLCLLLLLLAMLAALVVFESSSLSARERTGGARSGSRRRNGASAVAVPSLAAIAASALARRHAVGEACIGPRVGGEG